MLDLNQTIEGFILVRNETIYARCPKCNANLVIMDGIYVINCNECNINLEYDLEMRKLEILGRKVEFVSGKVIKSTEINSTLGSSRRYFPYLLLGIVTLGVGLIFYMMKNLRDLEEHETHSKEEKGAQPLLQSGETFLNFHQILQNRIFYSVRYMAMLCVITISYDLITAAESKYSSLYHHLKGQSKETAPIKSPHSAIFLISFILYIVSIAIVLPTAITDIVYSIPLVGLTFYIAAGVAGASFLVVLLCGAIWQKAFNEHVKAMRKLGYQ